jgi:hypothetical protein
MIRPDRGERVVAEGFVCSICGKEHAGLITDWAFKLPDEVWNIPEPERSEVARFNNDLCQWGERYFIRCVLEVPLNGQDGFFGWGAWAEVEWGVFERYLELYDEDGWSEPACSGALANDLSEYGQTIGVPVLIQFRDATKRPSLELLPTDQSLLAREQREGIDDRRYHEIVERLGG